MTRSKAAETTRSVPPSLAVDLANTVACPGCRGGDALRSTEEARRWIRRKLPGGRTRVDPDDLRALREFRDELRQLLQAEADHARPPPSALAAINRAVAHSPPGARLRWVRGTWVATEWRDGRSARERLTGRAARSVIDLLGRAHPPLVRRCQGPGCIHFLVARRSQQRWCSPTGCGNRARVQRHYRKHRSRLRQRYHVLRPQGRV